MKLVEFEIRNALRGGYLWRCTDIGRRVVVAIRFDPAEIGSIEGGRGDREVIDTQSTFVWWLEFANDLKVRTRDGWQVPYIRYSPRGL